MLDAISSEALPQQISQKPAETSIKLPENFTPLDLTRYQQPNISGQELAGQGGENIAGIQPDESSQIAGIQDMLKQQGIDLPPELNEQPIAPSLEVPPSVPVVEKKQGFIQKIMNWLLKFFGLSR